MKNFNNLVLSFPELEDCVKQSTKGGTNYNDYDDGSGGGWGNYGGYGGVNNPFQLPGVTITPDGGSGSTTTTTNGTNYSGWGYGYGYGSGNYGGQNDQNQNGGGGDGGVNGGNWNYTQKLVGSGGNGHTTSFKDVVDLMATSLGTAASHADIAASVMNLENAATFAKTSKIFGVYDIVSNVISFVDHPNWTDAGQIALGVTVTFGELTPVGAIVGTTALVAWELYEYQSSY